ncbi:MAG: hypothetical protein IKL20_05045 [Alistipes sp.]|nr:hypothetical protein [Alistipes sp.]
MSEFNEALYASSKGVVVERRKSLIVPILVLLAGIALLVVNFFIENGDDANNLKSTLVLAGGAVVLLGVALCGIRIFGSGAPYHKGDKCMLVCKQYSFDRSQQDEVVKIVTACDKEALDNLEEGDIAGVAVLCYHSPRGKFVAMQAFAYEEFTYKEITSFKVKAE